MRALFLFFIVFSITGFSYGQNGINSIELSYRDSVALTKTWKTFKASFDAKDTKNLRQLSLKMVECNMSIITKPHNTEKAIRYIAIDTFLSQAYKNLASSKFWCFQVYQIKYFHPPNLKYKKDSPVKIYEVWYDTDDLNPNEARNRGQHYAFEFIKIKEKFTFFGLTSAP